MSRIHRRRTRLALCLFLALVGAVEPGCGASEPPREERVTTQRPVAEVIREYAPRWMEHDGIEGVYEGRTDEGAPCLKVMVVEVTDELRELLPDTVDGYPVLLRPTGPIGPVGDS